MSKQIENPITSLLQTIPFSSRDWGQDKRDAWVYGIVCGWDEDCFEEFKEKFGWSRDVFDRLSRLHNRFKSLEQIADEFENK